MVPLDLSSFALLVIDMQVHFPGAAELLPKLIPLIQSFRSQNQPVIFTQHGHPPNDHDSPMYRRWGNSINRFSSSWELFPELALLAPDPTPYAESIHPSCIAEKVVRLKSKSRYDAFIRTELEDLLKSWNCTGVVITGTLTNLCCETTARSAFCRDFEVLLPTDANFTDVPGLDNVMEMGSVKNLEFGFVSLCTTENLIDTLEKSQERQT